MKNVPHALDVGSLTYAQVFIREFIVEILRKYHRNPNVDH